MFSLFTQTRVSSVNEGVLGLHILDGEIRWVHVIGALPKARVSGHGILPLPSYAIEKGVLSYVESITEALGVLSKYNNIPVSIIIPTEHTHVFTVAVPLKDDYTENNSSKNKIDITQRIKEVMSSYIARETRHTLDDVICEYEIVGESDNNANTIHIVGITYPRSLLLSYTDIVRNAGFNNIFFESLPYSVARLHSDSKHTYLMVSIESEISYIALVHGSTVTALQKYEVGENNLIETIKSFLSIDHDSARRIHDKHGLRHTHHEPELLKRLQMLVQPLIDKLLSLREKHHISVYQPLHDRGPIQEIVVLGRGSHILGFIEHLEQALQLPVRHVDIWRLFPEVTRTVPEIDIHDIPIFAPALAGAVEKMRKI